jgi:uncharacterized membrane protein YphA (DoxX/SURF4 family)
MKRASERVRDSWARYWFTPVAPYWLGACRIIVGLQLCNYLRHQQPWDPFSTLGEVAILPDQLWEPVQFVDLLGLGPPDEATLTAVWGVTMVAAAAMTIGLATRPASALAAAGGIYLITIPNCYGDITHGFNVLAMMLLVLPFARTGAALSVDSLVRRARGTVTPDAASDFNWPVKLIQFSFAFMLLFAGWNKLVVGGPDWVFSESLRNIVLYQSFVVQESQPAAAVQPLVENPWLWQAVAAWVVLSELSFIAIMFVQRTWQRVALLGVAVGFILGLAVVMQLPNPTLLWLLPVFVNWNWVARKVTARLEQRPHALREATADRI